MRQCSLGYVTYPPVVEVDESLVYPRNPSSERIIVSVILVQYMLTVEHYFLLKYFHQTRFSLCLVEKVFLLQTQ